MGLNTEYQLGLPWVDDSMAEVPVPQIVPLPEPCTDVACGSTHTIAIAESGNLWSWGSASCVAPLGLGKKARSSKEPKLVDALRGVDIASVACGSSHTMALSQQGELFSWGLAMKGCLGHEPASKWLSSEHLYYPKLVRSLTDEKMVKVAAGHYHSACISHDGDVYFWGSGEYGQTTHRRDITVPQHFERGKFKDVACGGKFNPGNHERARFPRPIPEQNASLDWKKTHFLTSRPLLLHNVHESRRDAYLGTECTRSYIILRC